MFAVLLVLTAGVARGQDAVQAQDAGTFRQVDRPGSVDLEAEFDLSGLTIPRREIHTLLSRDAIRALTDPPLRPANRFAWLAPSDRLAVAVVEDEAVGVPLGTLERHEIVNLILAGQPIAITYCPLCDSAAVFDRTIDSNEGDSKKRVLEFGVSGALYHSNLLMYDRQQRGLWSQIGMRAVSGPLVGTRLQTRAVRVMRYANYLRAYPHGALVDGPAGAYRGSPYARYFAQDDFMVPVRGGGRQLSKKTVGLGIDDGHQQWFIQRPDHRVEVRLETAHGAVRIRMNAREIMVVQVPAKVRTVQTFYYAWSAFYPNAILLRASEGSEGAASRQAGKK